jgi:hypothetical protein
LFLVGRVVIGGVEPGFEDLKITFQPRQVGRPTGHISHTGQEMAPDNVAPGDRLAGEPEDANDADVVEILAFQIGLTMPLTGLGRLAEGAGVVPPVLSATHVWITRGQSHDILEGRGASFLMCAVRASHALRKRKFMLREIAGVASQGGPPRSEGRFPSGYAGEPEGNAAAPRGALVSRRSCCPCVTAR